MRKLQRLAAASQDVEQGEQAGFLEGLRCTAAKQASRRQGVRSSLAGWVRGSLSEEEGSVLSTWKARLDDMFDTAAMVGLLVC